METSNQFSTRKTQYNQILDEICATEGIKITWLSSNWLGVLQKGDKQRCIVGHKFDINAAVAGLVADDKYATFETLSLHHVPMIEHALLYEESNNCSFVHDRQGRAYIEEYFKNHDEHIVIKPNDGFSGHRVFQLTTLDDLETVLQKIFHQSYSASLCPFYEIEHEYRVILLDGDPRLVYQKNRGDSWKFNLCSGATPTEVMDKDLEKSIISLAQRAAKAVGLRFTSVDVIETVEHELLIMEVNSGVMTEHYLKAHPEDYNKVKAIYHDVVRKMFTDPR